SLFSALGTRVTIVEMLARVLPGEDEEVSALLAAELKKQGVTILAGTCVDKVSGGPDGVTTSLASGEPIISEKVLVSVGRRFNTAGLGLDDAGVVLGSRGETLINQRMETNHQRVYASGDDVGK